MSRRVQYQIRKEEKLFPVGIKSHGCGRTTAVLEITNHTRKRQRDPGVLWQQDRSFWGPGGSTIQRRTWTNPSCTSQSGDTPETLCYVRKQSARRQIHRAVSAPAAVRKRSRDNPGGRQSMSFKLPTILSCVTKSHLGCDSSWWLWSSDTYLITAPNGSNSDAGTCRSANEEPWCASFTRKVRPYRESMVQRVGHHPVSGNCWDLGTQSPADMGGLPFTHSEWVHFSTFKTKQKKCLRMHAEMLKEKLQRKRESDNINSAQWWTWGIWEGDRMEGVWNVVANDFMVAGYVGICFVIFL